MGIIAIVFEIYAIAVDELLMRPELYEGMKIGAAIESFEEGAYGFRHRTEVDLFTGSGAFGDTYVLIECPVGSLAVP